MKFKINNESKCFEVEVDETKTVRALKRKIAKIRQCKVADVHLILDGKVLVSSRPLSSIHMNPDGYIDLIIEDESAPPQEEEPSDQDLDQAFLTAIMDPKISSLLSNYSIHEGIKQLQDSVGRLASLDPKYEPVYGRLSLLDSLSAPLEEVFADQLAQMEEMGLTDKEANIAALCARSGDIDDAVIWLEENGKI